MSSEPRGSKSRDVMAFFNDRTALYSQYSKWAKNPDLAAASAEMLNGLSGSVAVDAGAGSGLLLPAIPPSFRLIVAADISFSMLRSIENGSVGRMVTDLHDSAFRSASIDLVVLRQVLHYCAPDRVLVECRRTLTATGAVHVVQLTDYDGVDRAWVDRWVSFRGIRGRRRLTEGDLEHYHHVAGLTIRAQRAVSVRVTHSWAAFFAKNLVSAQREEEVKAFFGDAPADTARKYHLVSSEEGISYTRRFSLLLSSQS